MADVSRTATCRLDAGWKRTDEGFLDASVYITRPGVFPYWDNALQRVVMEFRPPEEVYAKAHLDSYMGKPFTDNHPPEAVKMANFKKYQAGSLYGDHAKAPDGLHTQSRVMVHDEATIAKIEAGKDQVSAGYKAVVLDKAGSYQGVAYERVQTNMRGNHVALVDRGRMGPGARLRVDGSEDEAESWRFDACEMDPADMPAPAEKDKQKPKEGKKMAQMQVDSYIIDVDDKAEVVIKSKFKADADALTKAQTDLQGLQTKFDTLEGQKDQLATQKQDLETQITELKKLDHKAIGKEWADVQTKANPFLPKDFKADSAETVHDVMAAALTNSIKGLDLTGKSPDYIKGRFDTLIESAKGTPNKPSKAFADAGLPLPKGEDKTDGADDPGRVAYNNMYKIDGVAAVGGK